MRTALLLAGLLAAACGNAPAEPSTAFPMSGFYTGPLDGVGDEGTLDALMDLTVQEDQGRVSGAYFLRGRVTRGNQVATIVGEGTFTGTIFPGARPSLALTLSNPPCPDHPGELGGWFDPVAGGIQLGGLIQVRAPDCSLFASYQSWALLGR